ncbi:hypothetical protein [Sulfurimonas sp.]
MKKILGLLLIFITLSASDYTYELKIYNTLLSNIFPNKHIIKVWSDSAKKRAMLSRLTHVQFVSKQKDANILIIQNDTNANRNKPIFVTNYKMLLYYKNSAIGGFYWKKGRPNILFLKSNLQKYHIHLPNIFDKYIEDDL